MNKKIVAIAIVSFAILVSVGFIWIKRVTKKEVSSTNPSNTDTNKVSKAEQNSTQDKKVVNDTMSENTIMPQPSHTQIEKEENMDIDREDSKKNKDLDFEPVEDPKDDYIRLYGKKEYTYAQYWGSLTFNMMRVPIVESDIEEIKAKYQVEEITLEATKDGHKITADHILANKEKNRDTVIVVHGLSCNRRTRKPIIEAFLNMGYNVFSYDLSGAGENESDYVTYGAYEQFELLDCINYIRSIISKDKKLVVFGYSYGGGVTGVALGNKEIDDKIDYAILDAPVTDLRELLKYRYRYNSDYDPTLMEVYFEHYVNLKYGVSMTDLSAKENISRSTTPILVIASKADDIIPAFQVEDFYHLITSGKKYLCVLENAPHTSALASGDRNKFLQVINDFLEDKLTEE